MKYQIDVNKMRNIQSKIWSMLKGTFRTRYKKDGDVDKTVEQHYGAVFSSSGGKFVIHTDGVGTKILIAQMLEKYDTIGIDAIAMNVNDIVCLGAEPLVALDYIALTEENEHLVKEIMKGLVKGCEESNCALVGGETAIMNDVITGYKDPFDLVATVLGKIQIDKPITGQEIKEGNVIIGLESSGLHSNGYTLVRKVLDISSWEKELIEPTRIYVNPIIETINNIGAKVKGIAHITGGAFGKITRLTKKHKFVLDDLPEPPEIFKEIEKKVRDKKEMYRTFNMGIGMIVVIDKEDEEEVLNILNKYVKAHRIGKIDKGEGVYIKAKGNGEDIRVT